MPVRRTHTSWILLALSGAFLVVACGRDTAGVLPRLSATYVLETVNGDPLPSAAPSGNTGRIVRIADTLVFSANGGADRHLTIQFVGLSTATPDTTIHTVEPLAYRIDGDRLTIGVRSCPPNANCVGPSEGRIDARHVDLVDAGWNNAALHFTAR
jgi:hypothetical protein